ncbi:hypothetical protein L873DRAFT_1848878 [Choiromyces venosus 120613-1]|uniref:F-box domain-containing protein n=1 Tax=Choiromyces venosus 120613-1 TaxID=1336337 RepID=A0A3N4J133_9PEZI|nr:hypothetical protein L873DRAFT_1848878 [Choiromyces venosus 120613-1]
MCTRQIRELPSYIQTTNNPVSKSPIPLASLPTLPAEILLEITNHLTTKDIAFLRETNRHLSNVLANRVFYSVIKSGHPTSCQEALFEAAFRDDKELIKKLIRRGILKIAGRTYSPLIEQAIYEFHDAETIGTLVGCLVEEGVTKDGAIEKAVGLAQGMEREGVVEVLVRYLE